MSDRPFQGQSRRIAARVLGEWEDGFEGSPSAEDLDRLELLVAHAIEEALGDEKKP